VKPILLFLTLIALLIGCHSSRSAKKAKEPQISFGSGGGFTGLVEEFILHKNGTLFKVNAGGKDTVLIKTLDKKTTQAFFESISTNTMQKLELNQAGNMNYFVTLLKGREIVRSFHWTDGSDIPQELKKLYDDLMGEIKVN
jgi:hypothetical protein